MIFARAFNEQKTLGIEILDVDYFKEFNDTYGHQAGDEVLKAVADVIRQAAGEHQKQSGKSIVTARYGGDEFVVIYLGYNDEEILQIAGEMRDGIKKLDLKNEGSQISERISISQGIRNSVPRELNRVWDYFYAADNALYDVKKNRRGEIELIHTSREG